MEYLVESREMPARPTMARRARLPVDRIGPWLAESYALISSSLRCAGVPIVGPPYARFAFAPDSTRWRTDVVVPYRSRPVGSRDGEGGPS